MQRARVNSRAWIAGLALVLLSGDIAVRAQEDPVFTDAVSREFTFANLFVPTSKIAATESVVSRELTVANLFVPASEVAATRSVVSREFTIATAVADLGVVSILPTPVSGLPRRPATASWRATNVAAGLASGPWTDRVYLSTDLEVGNDELLGEVTYDGPPIKSGESYDATLNFEFPLEPGQYRLVVETGVQGGFGEENFLNNTLLDDTPIRVDQPPSPNLVVAEVTAPVSQVLAGSTTQITFRVENASANPTYVPSWADSVFLTVTPQLANQLSSEPYYLGSFDNPTVLGPGESYVQTVEVTLPEKILGEFYFAVYTDSARIGGWRLGDPYSQLEENDGDNWLFSEAVALEITSSQPDLRPSGITFFPQTASGVTFEVSWRDENIGSGPTDQGSWRDAIYLSLDQEASISQGDLLLGTVARSGPVLLPAEDAALRLERVLAADLSGSYHVKVETDIDNVISEFGLEGNNVSVSAQQMTVTLSPSVDLMPVALDVPALGFPGHLIPVAWRIDNIGAPPLDLSYSWQDAIYVSVDAQFDPGTDVRIGTFNRSTSRDTDGNLVLESYDQGASLRLPNNLDAGMHYLVLVADFRNSIFEGIDNPGPQDDDLKEGNNVLVSIPFEVSLLSTDLVMDASQAVPRSAAAGQALPLAWVVMNTGTIETPVAAWTDAVYFSRNEVLDATDTRIVARRRSFVLAGGESYTTEENGRVPLVPEGEYFLIFATDSAGDVLELPPGEDNNNDVLPFDVTGDAPDLAVTEIRCPDTARAGDPVLIEWSVDNLGPLRTGTNLWNDRVYLSDDRVLDSTDQLLGFRARGDFLEPGASYSTSQSFTLPVDLSGAFHVLLETDAASAVFETNEANNVAAKEMLLDVERLPASNLVVTDLRVAAGAVSGQTIGVTWTVENQGDGPTSSVRWRDSVFLSLTAELDPSSDFFLGSALHEGSLGPGEKYTVDATFDVPLGVSGSFVVFVVTDRGASNHEDGQVADNQLAGDGLFDVTLPLASDLAVADVLPAAAAVLGEDLQVDWRLTNLSGAPVSGRWNDSVFLSADDVLDLSDPLVGRFISELQAPLGAGQSSTFGAVGKVPAVTPGSYHVLVRANVLAQIVETDRDNNLGVSAGRIEVNAPALLLDAAAIETQLSPGRDRYSELATPEDLTVRVTLDHSSRDAWTELYVSQGVVPTPGRFDLRFEAVGEADHEIVIPDTVTGTYYVLARSIRGPADGPDAAATLDAATVPFSVESVRPSRVGDRGRVTVTFLGSRFEPDAMLELVGPAGERLVPRARQFIDDTRIEAVYVLDGISHGAYDASITLLDGRQARLAGALTAEAATGPILEVAQPDPPALRAGAAAGTMDLAIVNRGNVDAEYVFLLDVLEEADGREVLRAQATSSFATSALRGDRFHVSAILRSIAPGETAALSVTARAGLHSAEEIPVGHAAAVFTTEEFLALEVAAAEAVRLAVLRDHGLIAEEQRDTTLPLARSTGEWQAFWLDGLARAELVESSDVDDLAGVTPVSSAPGLARCVGRTQAVRDPSPVCRDMSTSLCEEWPRRLVETGVEAAGVFARTPEATGSLPCALERLVSCTLCTFWPVKSSLDPNEKTGGEGTGDEGFVPGSGELSYRIHFENQGSATAPASFVQITDPLDTALNPASVRFGDISVGGRIIDVRPGSIVVSETLELDGEMAGLAVQVSARVDAARDTVLWTFQTIELETGLQPTDGRRGFLPPSDGTEAGQGWVEFKVRPKPSVASRIEIKNEAGIVFDANEEIRTAAVVNTVDSDPPSSALGELPASQEGRLVDLFWSGVDPADGAGVSTYTVYVSENGGPFVPVISNTSDTAGVFDGDPGKTYAFYTLATDHAGNEEPPPTTPDQVVIIAGDGAFFLRGDADDDGEITINDGIRSLRYLFLGDPPPVCEDAADANDMDGITLTDAVFTFCWLFSGGEEPPTPGPHVCGPDPTADALAPCGGDACR